MSFLPDFSSCSRALLRLLLGSRLPLTGGQLKVKGLRGPVTIRRDRYGIPMIEADDELDVFFGFGFCQGQDRAMQIELSRRAAAGTLSELFGKATLPVDRLVRRVGLRPAAEAQFAILEPRISSIITAFASGVNAGHSLGLPRRPHELVLLRAPLTDFTAIDVVSIMKLQSLVMPSNWDSELARLMVFNLDGPESLLALDPQYPEWHPVPAPPAGVAGSAAERLAEDLAALQETMGTGGGSNGWAVSGSRTLSGRPLLANDPHLSATLPPHWYLARLQAPQWALAGAALPGTPAMALGHNGNCAWGVTAGLLDNTDLFLEQIGPDGRSVLEDGQYVPCQVRRELIRIRGGDSVEEEVLVTPRGPMVSPALGDELGAISMRALWLDPLPLRGFLDALEATSFEEFFADFAQWPILPLGMVYADTRGNIGYRLVGQAPCRTQGNGTLPAPGWVRGNGWDDEGIPFNRMPSVLNPSSGFIAAANTQPEPHGSGPFLGVDWVDGYRLGRILEALDERSDWDISAASALQLDVKSMPWEEMREVILSCPPASPESRAARELLQAWDGAMSASSPGATLFHILVAELSSRTARVKAPRSHPWALGRSLSPVIGSSLFAARQTGRVSRLLRSLPEGWFPNGWPAEIDDALRSAYLAAVGRLGQPSESWQWGRARSPATLTHPLGRLPVVGSVFNLGPFPFPGDANTVAQTGAFREDPLARPGVVPSLRMVLDVGNWDESLFSLPGGQSGNPLSPHYADLLPFWLRGAGVPIPWTRQAIENATVETLLLKPEATSP
ncbi:MAG: penicillin acylase family protein [Chloroflexota bacterium]|nr:penicillin acylase family protein [Chloroflexota bacterium]